MCSWFAQRAKDHFGFSRKRLPAKGWWNQSLRYWQCIYSTVRIQSDFCPSHKFVVPPSESSSKHFRTLETRTPNLRLDSGLSFSAGPGDYSN